MHTYIYGLTRGLAEQAMGGASDVEQKWLLILSMRRVNPMY